jgi:DNA-binding transcriptional MerR regulator
MTPRNVPDPDAITVEEASVIAGISVGTAQRYRREGLFTSLPGRTPYSRREAEQLAHDPWLSGVEAAEILGVSHVRVTQLANKDKIPYHEGASGRRYYKRSQLEVVANARDARKFGFRIESTWRGENVAGGSDGMSR